MKEKHYVKTGAALRRNSITGSCTGSTASTALTTTAREFRILLAAGVILFLAMLMSTGSVFAASVTDSAGNTMTISGTEAAGKVIHVEATGVNQDLYTEDPAQIAPELPDGEILYLPTQVKWTGANSSGGTIALTPDTHSADITAPYVGACKITVTFTRYTLQTLAPSLSAQAEQSQLAAQLDPAGQVELTTQVEQGQADMTAQSLDQAEQAEQLNQEEQLDQTDQLEESATRSWIASGNTSIVKSLTIKGSVLFDAGVGHYKNGKSVSTKYYTNGSKLTSCPTPTADKKFFTGWYTKKTGGTQVTKNTKVSFGTKQKITYYAHWEKRGTKSPIISYKGKNATRVPVITYHRLASAKEKRRHGSEYSSLFVVNTTFQKQMKWLDAHGYTTLSMEEFYLWYTGKIKVPKKSVVITFDDGMYSVIKYGLPVLEKYNMKATMFMIGNAVHNKTNKKPTARGTYHTTGKDVINYVTQKYPDFEFQSHTWGMHVRAAGGNGYARTKSYAYQKADFKKMYQKFGYEFLAYPFGHYTKRTIKAAKAGHIKMAFTYGANAYATRSQSRYAIRRIKIDGNESMARFTRWF